MIATLVQKEALRTISQCLFYGKDIPEPGDLVKCSSFGKMNVGYCISNGWCFELLLLL